MNILDRYLLLIINQDKAGEVFDYFYKVMTPEQYQGALQTMKIAFGFMVERTEENKHIVKFDRDFARQIRKEYEAKTNQ